MLKIGRFLSLFPVSLTQVFEYPAPKEMLCDGRETIIDHTKLLKNSLGK